MYDFLFLDLDDTILDFHKAERLALSKTLTSFGITPTDAVCARYSQINKAHWEMLERKEITRPQVLVGRFAALLRELDAEADPAGCAGLYEQNLARGHWFLPGAEDALTRLSKKFRLYLASNGTATVQAGRLDSAGIRKYFQEIFVSEEIGADKPDPLYFQRCFARIPDFDPHRAIIVGDSLTSDILGGKNAGIATCWVNPTHKPSLPGIRPDFEIEGLYQLEALLEAVCVI